MLSALVSIFGTGFVGSVLIIVFKRVLDRHDAERQVQDKVQANQQQAQQAEQVAIKEGVVALLHDRLYAMYGECAIVGHASVETLRNADYLYRPYHELGGNGTGTELYNRIKSMPPASPAEKGSSI